MPDNFEWISQFYRHFITTVNTGVCRLIWNFQTQECSVTWSCDGYDWEAPLEPPFDFSAANLGCAYAHLALGDHRKTLFGYGEKD